MGNKNRTWAQKSIQSELSEYLTPGSAWKWGLNRKDEGIWVTGMGIPAQHPQGLTAIHL